MAKVTTRGDVTRRSSYHFFAAPRSGADPIFVRRTAARLPPQMRPGSRATARARTRFAEANRTWKGFDTSQRAFWRRVALEVAPDPPGRQPKTKLLSGQELFIALYMAARALLIVLGIIPKRYEPFGGSLCGDPMPDLELEIYSKKLKRTVGIWKADGSGEFQWISLPEYGAPYRICARHPDLGEVCTQYETLEALLALDPYPVVHPVGIYTRETDRWTLSTDPTWCKKHCEAEIYNQYDFEDIHEEGPPDNWNWQDSQLQVLHTAVPHRYLVRWKAMPHVFWNTIYWKEEIIFVPGNKWWPLWSAWKAIDGRTGLPWEE